MINTAAELDALPVGAAFVDKYGDLGLIDRIEGQRVVLYAETDAMSVRRASRYLPATVLHDPSAPTVPVVSDAAVEVALVAISGAGGHGRDCRVPDEPCSCGLATFRRAARDALTAALPLLGAVPSATREELSALLLTFLRPPKHGGSWTYSPDEAADALLARFTITPRADR